MTARASDRGEKRRRLIQAAATVFARQGYSATRVADIAVEAGVGKGTLYEYFPSKEDLFFAVFEAIHADARARITRSLASGRGGLARLREMLAAGAEIVAEQRPMHGVTLDFWAASIGSPHEGRFKQICKTMYCDYRELAAATLRDGQASGEVDPRLDADAVATLLVATFDGLGVQCWFDPGLDPQAITARFVDALCDGLVPRDRAAGNPAATGS